MPTVLILLFTLFIMVTVIPYAFSSVIKQLQAVQALEAKAAQGRSSSSRRVTEATPSEAMGTLGLGLPK